MRRLEANRRLGRNTGRDLLEGSSPHGEEIMKSPQTGIGDHERSPPEDLGQCTEMIVTTRLQSSGRKSGINGTSHEEVFGQNDEAL